MSRHVARIFPLLLLLGVALVMSTQPSAFAQEEPPPVPQQEFGDILFRGGDAREGTEVNFSISGVGVIKTTQTVANPPGIGGFSYNAKVPGDDPNTTQKDGADTGDLVTIFVGDFLGTQLTFTGLPLLWASGDSVRAADIDILETSVLDLEFSLSPSQPRVNSSFRVSGTVRNLGTGNPEAGATVTATWGDGDSDQATTSGSGTFSLIHPYAAEGDVTLVVDARKADFVNHKFTQEITVRPKAAAPPSRPPPNEPPVADAGGPYTGLEGSAITFDASGSTDSDGLIVIYTWDFDGDGDTDAVTTSPLIQYTYDDDGDSTVTLTVTDDDGDTASDTTQATIDNVAPTVVAGDDTAALIAAPTVTIEPSFEDPGVLDTHRAIVDWGDGTEDSFDPVTSPFTASYTYPEVRAEYTVTVTVIDDDGGEGSDTLRVRIDLENQPPIARATADPTIGVEGSAITFDGSASTDLDGDDTIVRYEWDFGDGSTGAGIVDTHAYADDGHYTVTLTVTDDLAVSDSTTLELEVLNLDPTVGVSPETQAVDEGGQASITGTLEDPGDDDTHTVLIAWGDGATDTFAAERSFSAFHPYADDGEFDVVVIVTDDDGGQGLDSVEVTVNNVAPTVNAGPGQAELLGVAKRINASFSDPGRLDTHVADIDWGDGTSGPGVVSEQGGSGTVVGSHTYPLPGIYTVTVTVEDKDRDSGDDHLTNVVLTPVVLPEGIEVIDVTVDPTETVAGVPVIASVTIRNIGETTLAEVEIDVLVNNEVEATLTFEDLVPGQSATQKLSIMRNIDGIFAVQAGLFVDIFTIHEADLQVLDPSVAPVIGGEGDPRQFVADIENQGGTSGGRSFALAVDGTVERQWTVNLVVGETFTLFHEFVPEGAGPHAVELFSGLDRLFSGEVQVLVPQLKVEVKSEQAVSERTVAFGESGRRLVLRRNPVTGQIEEVRFTEGSVRLVIPVVLEEGEELDRFVDPVSNITITGTDFEIPIRDPVTGRTTIRLSGELLTPITGEGNQASAVTETVIMTSEDREQDLSADDPRVGLVTTNIDADLVRIPPESRLTMLLRKELSAEDRTGLEQLARRSVHPVTRTRLTIGEVAAAAVIDTTLSNETDVDQVRLNMTVGEEWVNAFLDPNLLLTMGHVTGEGDEKRFEFISGECEDPNPDHPGQFFCTGFSDGFSVFSLLALVPVPALLSVTGVTITPQVVEPSEPVVVAAEVFNAGTQRGSFTAILTINGEAVGAKNITLDGGQGGAIRFFVIRQGLGLYQVDVDGNLASFEVARALDQADVQILDVRVEPTLVQPGEPVTVTVAVLNTGEEAGSAEVELFVNDALNQVLFVTVPAQDVREVEFTFVPETEGTYRLRSGDKTARLDAVIPRVSPLLELSDLQVSPIRVLPGEEVTVTLRAANVGDIADDFTIELQIRGVVVDQQVVSLAGNSSILVTFALSRDVAGVYRIQIGNLPPVSFEVVAPPVPSVSGLTLSAMQIVAGDTVTITVLVTNEGDQAAERVVELTIDGQLVESQTVTVPGNASRSVEFQRTFSELGTFEVGVDGLSETVVVGAVPVLVVRPGDLTVEPDRVTSGDPVAITLRVRNEFDETVTGQVTVTIDGEQVLLQDVTLAGGQDEAFTFDVTERDIGTHTVAALVDGQVARQVQFEVSELPVLVVRPGDLTVEPDRVTSGDPVTITLRVRNEFDEPASAVVRVIVDVEENEVFFQEVTVGGGEVETFTFDVVETDTGSHSVVALVNGQVVQRVQFEVVEAAAAFPIIIIILPIIIGVVVVAVAAWYFYFRRRWAGPGGPAGPAAGAPPAEGPPAEETAPAEGPPAEEEQPVEEAAPAEAPPAEEEQPVEEEAPAEAPPAEEEQPVEEVAPAEGPPAEEEQPVEEVAPAEAPPAEEEQPVEEAVPAEAPPAEEEQPVEEVAPAEAPPAEEEQPVEEAVPAEAPPAEEEQPVEEVAPAEAPPAEEEQPVEEEAPAEAPPAEEEQPVEEAPPSAEEEEGTSSASSSEEEEEDPSRPGS